MNRVGRGEAHAAIGILNATATGIGCSLAIQGGVSAEWTWTETPGLRFEGPSDARLAAAVLMRLQQRLGRGGGAAVRTTSTFPPSRGLKTSSSAAAALVRAAHDAAGASITQEATVAAAIQASRDAEVTLTGAFDDQVAVVHGGCHITDNAARSVLHTHPQPAWHVAVWVPEARIPKPLLAPLDAHPLAPSLAEPIRRAKAGDLAGALTRSGAVFTRFYASRGLPVTDAPAQVALERGAAGAGLSGTGPAVAALFDQPVLLPAVAGGQWSWHRPVEARP